MSFTSFSSSCYLKYVLDSYNIFGSKSTLPHLLTDRSLSHSQTRCLFSLFRKQRKQDNIKRPIINFLSFYLIFFPKSFFIQFNKWSKSLVLEILQTLAPTLFYKCKPKITLIPLKDT